MKSNKHLETPEDYKYSFDELEKTMSKVNKDKNEPEIIHQLNGYEYFEKLNLFVFHIADGVLSVDTKDEVIHLMREGLGSDVKVLILDGTFKG
ncbi:hypothetical protein [Weissella hellenica]|uniref:hypothetical protein n=1 Tax=Weissella hellenica TaxID=46256 RepID=UPI0038855F63